MNQLQISSSKAHNNSHSKPFKGGVGDEPSDIKSLQNEIERLKQELYKVRQKPKKPIIKCTFCGRNYHTEERCFKKHGRPNDQEGNDQGAHL